jgi:oligopeptide transport system substrate-binding protein
MSIPRIRWVYLLMSLIAVLALALAACGDDDDDDGGDEETPTGAASPTEGEAGGEITVQITEPESLDPHFSDFSVDITIIQMTTRGLYDLLPGGELRPAYAAGPPEVGPNNLTYTIPIKDGMTWADGEPLDANDFVAGIQRTCNPDLAGHYQYILTSIGGCDDYYAGEGALEDVAVTAPDNLTLQITLSAPQATFPSLLALWPTYPAPESVAITDAWPEPPDTPCNGPFCATSFEPGAAGNLVLEPNSNWGLEPEPKLDKITLQFIDDFSQALRAYDAGDLDMTRVGQQDLPTVRDRDDFYAQPLPITIGLEFLMTDELLSDRNVRLALSRATNRDLYSEVVFNNGTIPTTNWVPAEEPGANAQGAFEDVIGFDEAAAQQALADAGYPDGEGFPGVSFIIRDDATELAAAEFLQSQWKEILNIDLEIEQVDSQTRQDRFNSSNFQLLLGGWGHDYPDAENWLVGLYETGASINKQLCSDPAIDAAIASAKEETENEARWEFLREAEKLVVEGLCGIAPLYHRGNFYLINPDLQGVSPTLEDHYLPQFPEEWFLGG